MCLGGFVHGRPCVNCPDTISPFAPIPISVKRIDRDVEVPLTGVQCHVNIVDFTAEVTLKQLYENKEKDSIEATYEFPLEAKGAVSNFWAEIDGQKIIGSCKEKEEAKNIYDDAISSGHGAYLLEQETNTKFKASIGNLPPGKEVLVVLQYVLELEVNEDGKIVFDLRALPFPPNKQVPKFAQPMNSKSALSQQIGYGLKVKVDMKMSSGIKSVSSPSHPIAFEFGSSNTDATVTFSPEGGQPLTKDLTLLVSLFDSNKPSSQVQNTPDGRKVAMVAMYPKLEESEKIFSEILFLVDRSGSMSGSRINRVKETLQIFLRSLPEGTLFNIIGFGSSFSSLFKSSVEYNENHLKQAVDHVDKMTANMGGTEILNPLKSIFSTKPKEGIPRQLFVLTDGEVSNPDSCIDVIKQQALSTRVFTFGIGEEVSKRLVSGMAKAGNGGAEFVKSGDNMDEKVMRQLEKALRPALTDIDLKWQGFGGTVEPAPSKLPVLFGGSRFVAYAFLPAGVKGVGQAVLKGSTGDKTASWTIDVNTEQTYPGEMIYKLAAKAMIKELEEKGSDSATKKKIIDLSVKSSILSKHTAFVAVEKRTTPTEGEMKLRELKFDDGLQPAQQSSIFGSSTVTTSSFNSFSYGGPPPPSPSGGGGGMMLGGPPRGGPPRGGAPPPAGRGGAPSVPLARMKSSAVNSAPVEADRSRRSSNSSSTSDGGLLSKIGSALRLNSSPSTPSSNKGAPIPQSSLESSLASSLSARRNSSASDDEEDGDWDDAPKVQKEKSYAREEKSMKKKSISSKADLMDVDTSFSDDSPTFQFQQQQSQQQSNLLDFMGSPPPPPPAASSPSFDLLSAPPPPKPGAAPPPPSKQSASGSGDMKQVINTQAASGAFSVRSVEMLLPKANSNSFSSFLKSANLPSDATELLAVAVISALFETRFADSKASWNLVIKKAQTWLTKESTKRNISVDWKQIAMQFIAQNS